MAAMLKFKDDTRGDAVVEATVLFPIIIMIFAALVLLAIYLPTRAALQRATQYAATAISTEISDTWLFYNKDEMKYYWADDKSDLKNVYVALFSGSEESKSKGKEIVIEIEKSCISSKEGTLDVSCDIVNKIIYKEVVVTATRTFTEPVGLALIGFPNEIPVTVTSTAVVQNGDEFVRNMDMAVDFVEFLLEKLKLTDVADSISSFGKKASSFMGWK